MHPDRRLALLRLLLRLFLFVVVGAGSYYPGTVSAFPAWKSPALAWGICGGVLYLEQYRSETENLRTGQ